MYDTDLERQFPVIRRGNFCLQATLVIHGQCRQNLDDALSKLQAMIQSGVEAVTPAETDPETIKRVKQK